MPATPTEDYATPENFFRITFLTEGLQRVLTSALQRLAGTGGDPVIGLQTAFGGGKTHTHARRLPSRARRRDLGAARGRRRRSPRRPASRRWKRREGRRLRRHRPRAPTSSLILKDGPQRPHALGLSSPGGSPGEAGLELVAEAEAARTNPGSELMVEVFKLAGPEPDPARRAGGLSPASSPDDRFEAFLSFIQSLTEAAKMAPGVLIIGSLPESDAEAGGAKGVAGAAAAGEGVRPRAVALAAGLGRRDLRDHPPPPVPDARRRRRAGARRDGQGLPRPLQEERGRVPARGQGERATSTCCASPTRSTPSCSTGCRRIGRASTKFQRTRGVLRFMANVVGVLWQAQARDPLIMPARVPIAHERVRASVLYPLDPGLRRGGRQGGRRRRLAAGADGGATRPAASRRRAPRRGRPGPCSCARRRWSASPNAGLTGQGLRLACAEPGDQLAIFGEALRELAERATYLYEEAGRYWFSTQPTLNRLADDRAKALPDARGRRRDRAGPARGRRHKGGFHRVFAAPDDPIAIDEAQALSLVILGPVDAACRQGRRQVGRDRRGDRLHLIAHQPDDRWRAAAIRHVQHVDAGRGLEHLADHVA